MNTTESAMPVMKISHWKFQPFLLGFGYWKDTYKPPYVGVTHNLLLPFFRFQWGNLSMTKPLDEHLLANRMLAKDVEEMVNKLLPDKA